MTRTAGAVYCLFLISIAALPQASHAQVHFKECTSKTETNATIIIPAAASKAAGGITLGLGDEIAVVTEDGTCAGVGVWEGRSLGMSVWSADSLMEAKGLTAGEPLHFVVWHKATNTVADDLTISYAGGKSFLTTNGAYAPGAIYEVSRLALTTGAEEDGPKSFEFNLDQNAPNPFQNQTTIRYTLNEDGPVTLEVFDVLGRRVEVLVSGTESAGPHEVRFDGSRFSSGVYFYRLREGDKVQTRSMVLAN